MSENLVIAIFLQAWLQSSPWPSRLDIRHRILAPLGIGWYGLSRSNRSAAPVSMTPAPRADGSGPVRANTWELWSVMETYDHGAPASGPPTRRIELPIEKDLDRAACELIRQGKVRGALLSAADSYSFRSWTGV